MNTKELIVILQTLDPAAVVKTWDAYHDQETEEVYVCQMKDGTLLISNTDFNA